MSVQDYETQFSKFKKSNLESKIKRFWWGGLSLKVCISRFFQFFLDSFPDPKRSILGAYSSLATSLRFQNIAGNLWGFLSYTLLFPQYLRQLIPQHSFFSSSTHHCCIKRFSLHFTDLHTTLNSSSYITTR